MTLIDSGVLFVGALTLDTLYQVDDFSQGPGKYLSSAAVGSASGMATNAASAMARLGGQAALWASVGEDSTASALISEIEAEGVDCSHVRRVSDGRTATAAIVVDNTGERWVLVDYDPLTQANPMAHELPPVEQYRAVMVDVRWPGAARMALDAAREAGLLAILDADVARSAVLEDLAARATHIVASAPGATILSGSDSPADAARTIAEHYGCFVCVTDGGSGSFWALAGSTDINHTPSPKVDVIDTNGAGDVFHGAFSLALAEGMSPEEAIQFASSAAALKCSVLGGRLGAPGRQETLRLMEKTYHARQ